METKNSQALEKLPKKKLPRRENPCFFHPQKTFDENHKETEKERFTLPQKTNSKTIALFPSV